MILINNQEIIEIAKSSDFDEQVKKYNISCEDIPFVEIKHINNNYTCSLGYINVKTKDKVEVDIIIGHIKITSINIKVKKRESPYGNPNSYIVNYSYSIHTSIYDPNQNYNTWGSPLKHVFEVNQSVYFNEGIKASESKSPIHYLFLNIIPEINEILDKGVLIQKINFPYWDKIINELTNSYSFVDKDTLKKSHSIEMRDVLSMVYNLEVSVRDTLDIWAVEKKECLVKFIGNKNVLPNLYLANLFEVITNSSIKIINKEQSVQYIGTIKNLPKYYMYDLDAFKRYLQRKLYLQIFTKYNQEKAIEGFKYMVPIGICKEIIIEDNDIRNLLNFLLSIKVTWFEDGQYRAGRDDYGWYEYTILFSAESNFKPSESLVSIINRTLKINLEYLESDFCYYCQYTTESEPIPGMAKRRELNSESLLKTYLFDLLEKIIPLLKTDEGRKYLLCTN